jgi:hypothetical protein
VVGSQYYTDGPRVLINSFEGKGYNKILESRQRQFLRHFLSVEIEKKKLKNGMHQRLLREGVKNDVSDKMKMSNVFE